MKIPEAYEKAGYSPHESNCYRLSREEHIKSRVQELEEQSVRVAALDKSFVLDTLLYIANEHKKSNPQASVAAAKLLGQTEGLDLFVERSKTDINLLDLLSRSTPEQKEDIVAQLTAKLGIKPGDGKALDG